MKPRLPGIDELIGGFDKALRTLAAPARSVRPVPGVDDANDPLDEAERRHAAALMRVNHSGEICAQALYQGQALTARDGPERQMLEQAAAEETDHLAWTESRIAELGGRVSRLNPLWYAGSFAIGAAAGLAGRRWNLGFLAETEQQVTRHLEGHLERLPAADRKSRAVVQQMRDDEARHATSALGHGGAELPDAVKRVMQLTAKVMTGTSYWF